MNRGRLWRLQPVQENHSSEVLRLVLHVNKKIKIPSGIYIEHLGFWSWLWLQVREQKMVFCKIFIVCSHLCHSFNAAYIDKFYIQYTNTFILFALSSPPSKGMMCSGKIKNWFSHRWYEDERVNLNWYNWIFFKTPLSKFLCYVNIFYIHYCISLFEC